MNQIQGLKMIISLIIQTRFRKGWTQLKLSTSAGIDLNRLIQIEESTVIPNFQELQKIIRAFRHIPVQLLDILKKYPKHLDSFLIEIMLVKDEVSYQHVNESDCLTFSEYEQWAEQHITECKPCKSLYDISQESLDMDEYDWEDDDIELSPEEIKNLANKIRKNFF
jgi:transcriptional regulator with XRE-family HTH domain